jgi:hypothetical protein
MVKKNCSHQMKSRDCLRTWSQGNTHGAKESKRKSLRKALPEAGVYRQTDLI